MSTFITHISTSGRRFRWLGLGSLLAALALTFAATFGPSRVDAQASPQLVAGFPALSLSYADAEGPGQATITPHGPDAATGGTAIELTIAQAGGTFGGIGVVRQIDARAYLIAATIAGEHGDAYFVAGTLNHEGGPRWRGHGHWWAVGNRAVSGEWHMADWPAIEPPARPQLSTTVRLEPTTASPVRGSVTLLALPEGETRFDLQLAGLLPGEAYTVQLHAGTPGRPSASFTNLATVNADASGRASASGLLRFRGTEDIPLLDIADGNHFLSVIGFGQTVAVGSIPALQPLG